MTSRSRRQTLARTLAGMLLVIAGQFLWLRPSDAGSLDDVNQFFFPWVPNGDEANGVGPWYGKLSFQNIDEQTCPVSIFVGRNGSWLKVAQLSIAAGSSRSISANSLNIPDPGAPVQLEAQCAMTASVKMVTPNVSNSPWSDGARTVTGYTGLSGSDLDAAQSDAGWSWYLPIVQTNSAWNSIIRVSNASRETGSDVTVRLYSADNIAGAQGAVATVEARLSPSGSTTVDVLALLGIEGWIGFAEIEADGPVGAYVLRSKPVTRMALTNVATSGTPEPESERYILAAPLLFTAYNGWNTGINLANVSDEWASVTIRYFEAAGEMVRESQVQLAPWTMQYIYTPHNVEEEGFVGSAVIESDRPIAAAIDEVKYETTEAISYLASTVGQQRAAIPITFREDPQNGEHDNSGINIQSLNPDAAQTVSIRLITDLGEDVLPRPFLLTMPPGGNNFVYLPNLADVPFGTVAGALITSEDPFGFVALSNDVNYAVVGDGSVTFMAAGEAGYYRLLGSSSD
jgi:hypothetical protein